MIALLQRVARAHVSIDGENVGAIDGGLLVFLCAEPQDTPEVAERLLHKILNLRVFSDAEGRMNLSLKQTQGGLLVVSQFTLAADTRKGHRPGFSRAAPPEKGRALYEHFIKLARQHHQPVETGEFGADMQVHLVNDGPVTIPLSLTA